MPTPHTHTHVREYRLSHTDTHGAVGAHAPTADDPWHHRNWYTPNTNGVCVMCFAAPAHSSMYPTNDSTMPNAAHTFGPYRSNSTPPMKQVYVPRLPMNATRSMSDWE